MEKNIVDFWDNKHLYTDANVLKAKAREFYTEEFINNYSKWSQNLNDLNDMVKNHMASKNFPMNFWSEMTYDWFCTNINDRIAEWITGNGDITIKDLDIIVEKLIADFIAVQLTEYNEKAYTINALMASIKKCVAL